MDKISKQLKHYYKKRESILKKNKIEYAEKKNGVVREYSPTNIKAEDKREYAKLYRRIRKNK